MARHEQGTVNIQEKNSQDALYILWFLANKQKKVKKYLNRDSTLQIQS